MSPTAVVSGNEPPGSLQAEMGGGERGRRWAAPPDRTERTLRPEGAAAAPHSCRGAAPPRERGGASGAPDSAAPCRGSPENRRCGRSQCYPRQMRHIEMVPQVLSGVPRKRRRMLLLLEIIGVTLINKIKYVSGVQFSGVIHTCT